MSIILATNGTGGPTNKRQNYMKNLQLPFLVRLGVPPQFVGERICAICRHFIGTSCSKKNKSEAFLTKRY
jgi:hypothetical protein